MDFLWESAEWMVGNTAQFLMGVALNADPSLYRRMVQHPLPKEFFTQGPLLLSAHFLIHGTAKADVVDRNGTAQAINTTNADIVTNDRREVDIFRCHRKDQREVDIGIFLDGGDIISAEGNAQLCLRFENSSGAPKVVVEKDSEAPNILSYANGELSLELTGISSASQVCFKLLFP